MPGKGYFAILRLYGPTEAAIDKGWKPGDIEKLKQRRPRQSPGGSAMLAAPYLCWNVQLR